MSGLRREQAPARHRAGVRFFRHNGWSGMQELSPASWDGRRITVMGLGLHGGGLAVASWFLRHGAAVAVTDRKTRRELAPSVAELERAARERGSGTLTLALGGHRVTDFRDTDLVIQNPGVPRESSFLAIARAANVPIENEASLFLKMVREKGEKRGVGAASGGNIRIIGVTGTRGKSTTAALIHAMLREYGRTVFLAGNIRIPMLGVLDDVLRAAKRGPVDVVLELSSWHCEILSRATGGPDIAVLTNLFPDHLNRYRSMRSYAAAKARLVRFQDRRGVVIANAEQPVVRAMARLSPGRVVWFSRRRADGAALRSRALLKLPGEHNTMNALAAMTAARACGVPLRAIREALRSFRGLPGRIEVVARHRGVTFVNDTCATTPEAAIAALLSLRGARDGTRHIVLIAGGTDKNLAFDTWAKEVVKSVSALVFLPGTATEKMKRALKSFNIQHSTFNIQDASSMRSAVRAARRLARSGDSVLLSPAAASFGLFVHEFDRGDQFVHAVRAAVA